MANIARFKAGKTPEYMESVNTPEYSSDPDVIVNPDITAVQAVPLKFWNKKHPTQIRSVKWLVEKFMPIRGWSQEELNRLT